MKIYTSLLSMAAAAVLFTACSDTVIEMKEVPTSGDVVGCVYENIGGDGNPVVGAKATIGANSATTGNDGCFTLNVTSVNNNGALGDYIITSRGYEDSISTFDTENVVNGVMADLGDILLSRDVTAPQDKGIVGLKYDNNMLETGIDGKAKPFQLLLSEDVELLSTLDANTLVEVYDENGTELDLNVTATVTYDSKTKILSVTTSEAIAAGNMARVLMPQDSIADDASNIIVSGTNNTATMAYGDSLTDYIVFDVKVFKESTLAATAVATVTQLDEDTIVDGDAANTYHAALTALATGNATFKNVIKHDQTAGNAGLISNFNNDNNSRVQDLASAYQPGVTVASNVAKIKFTPTNANYYTVKAYDENNNSVTITDANDNINANTSVYGGTSIKVVVDNADDVELSFTIPGAISDDLRVKITPYTFDGLAGTAIIQTVKDNVAPTAALQYSYTTSDGVPAFTNGGVVTVTEEVYGGSGEVSNSTSAEDDNTTYSVIVPKLDMTVSLLEDQNATLDPFGANGGTFTALVTDYNASEYTAWSAVKTRSFGIGFTEPVESVTPAATGYVVTSEVNSTNLTNTNGDNEEVVIVTTTDIFAMVNENNGSLITLNVSDLAANTATSSVILNDLVAPYIVSEVNSTSITFSENILDVNGSTIILNINSTADACPIFDANITDKVVKIGHCAATVSGDSIDYSTLLDLNGNAQGDANNNFVNHTFRVY